MISTVTEDYDELEKIEIDLLLEGIYRHYGFDFRNYVFPSIRRRIWYRMRAEKLTTISALQNKILHDPLFMKSFLGDLSIHVTEMFRDPTFFLSFRKNVVPLLYDYPSIRIWHAGCSTGEEVYSMAILLHEEGLYDKTKIYATDIDELKLKVAESGIFTLNRMQQYTKNYLNAGGSKEFSEYYDANQLNVSFHPFLRRNITFAQHNLVTDHSFNEFHVIFCRNVMIYFNDFLQNQVHDLIYESLSFQGFLGLGSKEGIAFTKFQDSYEEIDGNEKIYKRIR